MMKIRRFEQSAIEASIMFDDDKGEYRGIDFDLRKSTIRLYAQMDKSAFTRWFPIADLIAFAKAGGKMSEVNTSDQGNAAAYRFVCRVFGITKGDGISDYIYRLQHERNALKTELVVCERDMASMDRTITARTAEVAKLTKVKVDRGNVRCLDCENLDLSKVKYGGGPCKPGTHPASEMATSIYIRVDCDHFTPAAKGCGSDAQALRAELARVTEEGGK